MSREPYFFNWEDRAARELFPGVRARIISGEKLMFSRVELEANSVVPNHAHPHEQFGFVVEGEVEFTIGGERRFLKAGDYYAIPGGVSHSVAVGPERAICMDVFGPPREEYR
jgi:quercetin dioxygenase-like cupin family protein